MTVIFSFPQPAYYQRCLGLDGTHLLDVRTSFFQIALIDTNSVNPDDQVSVLFSQVLQSRYKVLCSLECGTVHFLVSVMLMSPQQYDNA